MTERRRWQTAARITATAADHCNDPIERARLYAVATQYYDLAYG